ncbi:MAG: hypothetical protein ACTJG2_01440 [Candidatus Saccharimonadales bacterium]
MSSQEIVLRRIPAIVAKTTRRTAPSAKPATTDVYNLLTAASGRLSVTFRELPVHTIVLFSIDEGMQKVGTNVEYELSGSMLYAGGCPVFDLSSAHYRADFFKVMHTLATKLQGALDGTIIYSDKYGFSLMVREDITTDVHLHNTIVDIVQYALFGAFKSPQQLRVTHATLK